MAKDNNSSPAVVTLGPRDDYRAFLREVRFPNTAVIVRPEGQPEPRFEQVRDEHTLAQAMLKCFAEGQAGRVVLAAGD